MAKEFKTNLDISGDIVISGNVDGRDISADGGKLDGIEAGAEVNVQSDWNAGSGDAHILNKPIISGTNTGDEPDASTTTKGIVELATQTEVNTGSDSTRAVTPASLATIQSDVDTNTAKVGIVYSHDGETVSSGDIDIDFDNADAGSHFVNLSTAGTTPTIDFSNGKRGALYTITLTNYSTTVAPSWASDIKGRGGGGAVASFKGDYHFVVTYDGTNYYVTHI